MSKPTVARLLLLAALLAVAAACGGRAGGEAASGEATVARVADGDTIVLGAGERVRLVQIDATELGEGECYGRQATEALRDLLPEETAVRLEADPALDQVDEHGRLLRYVFHGELNVNLELVRRGAAAPYFYRGDRGRYADDLLEAAHAAREAGHGMWSACDVRWDPERPAAAEPR